MKIIRGVSCAMLLLSLPVASAAAAQDAGETTSAERTAPDDAREALLRFFENRLRDELALSDEQVQAILPRVQEVEASRQRARRERQELVQRLRLGLERGATDAELAAALHRLEAVEREQDELERTMLSGVENSLSVRQRVQLRFFVEEFRRRLQPGVGELREARGRSAGRPGGPVQGPSGRRRP